MDSEPLDLCQSLIEWFKTLNLTAPHSTVQDLSDGVAFAQALNQFAPETFTDSWLAKIKIDTGINWRLKMSNLKKVIEGIYDYYTDVLTFSMAEFPRPDAMKIAEKHDVTELERLLQLVLGCAINCTDKQNYITEIMSLEESVQRTIMSVIKNLQPIWQGSSSPSKNSISLMTLDMKQLLEERDVLEQKNFEYKKKITLLEEEKTNIANELAKLQNEVLNIKHSPTEIGEDGVSLGPVQSGSSRLNELRKQMDCLKEELLQSETARDDLKIKCQLQESEMKIMQQKIDDLIKSTAELVTLKDEVDILRESNEKLKVCELQLTTYKKKLEEYNDLKKHAKLMEEHNADYAQQIAQMEDDIKKCTPLKGQVELFKKQVEELHTKLDNEATKNVKLEFENKNLENNINALQRAKESLLKERDNLREAIDELKCGQLSSGSSLSGTTMSKELQPTALLDKLQRLEVENKALREGQGGQTALATLLDDANKRIENLRDQLKTANERILSLSHAAQSDDPNFKESELSKQIKQLMELNEQKSVQLEESVTQNVALQSKVTQLESTLNMRDQELIACDKKYRKSVDKAKEIIKHMDPRVVSIIDANMLEKNADSDDESRPKMSQTEEQLMTTALHRLAIHAQETKLAMLVGQSPTFLARQRQSAPRKPMTANFKGK